MSGFSFLRIQPHRALRRIAHMRRIDLQGTAHLAGARFDRLPGLVAFGVHRGTSARDFSIVDLRMDGAVRDVDLDDVAFFDEADQAAFRRFRADMANRKTGRAAGEAAIGDQGAGFAQLHRFEV